MADVRRVLPGVSDPTIRLVLALVLVRLREEGVVHVEGTGRGVVWRR